MALADLGIDPRVAEALEGQGIQELYPPQAEAWQAIDPGGNVVVAVPTASGKSLVAYLALLHNFLRTGRKGMYIVPLRALASEKFEELRAFRDLGWTVGIATGDLDEKDPRLGRYDVIVCTSEKADSLLRHRAGWVDQIGCVVADEVHLLHDPGRGPTLEVILSRFHALFPATQIVGLSATIANADALARWLDAGLVQSTWRPVKLRTGTYFGDNLHFIDDQPRQLDAGKDPVAALVEETLRDGGQCLVFVSTRRSAEAQAQRLAGLVRDLLSAEEKEELERLTDEQHGSGAGSSDGEDSPTAKKLRLLNRAGVSYHTAGLNAAQRKFVEEQFRARRLKVLCATPTLAAGVNTPARRVIIRDLMRFEMGYGNRPLPVMEVHQMMGRAGRPRYDPIGEAVLLCKSYDQVDACQEEYLHGEPEPITSKLAADAALRIHVLASVAGGYCRDEKELEQFLDSTFWAQETSEWVIQDRLDDVLWFLEDNDFIEREGGHIKATLFGKRTSDLYIDPFSALRLRQAIESPEDGTDFGLLEAVAGCPDIYPLYLRKGDDYVEGHLMEHWEEVLVPGDLKDRESALSYVKTAMLLSDWCNEANHQELEERYKVGPGDIRMRVDTAGWLVHAFRELARAFRPSWQTPLSELSLRLEHGVRKELLPLIRIKGVGRIRARTLAAHKFASIAALKKAPLDTIAKLPGFGPKLAHEVLVQVGGDVGSAPTTPPKAAKPAKTARKRDATTDAEQPPEPGTGTETDSPDTKAPAEGQASLASFGADP